VNKILFLLCLFLFHPTVCCSHGVSATIGSGGIVIKAEYSDGLPMSYAEIVISAPDAKLPFVSGWTDRNGRFCFFPDINGSYHAAISDELGHKLEMDIPMGQNVGPESKNTTQSGSDGISVKNEKALFGVTIINILFSFLFYIKALRLNSKSKKPPQPPLM
jgi:nickel transport protein